MRTKLKLTEGIFPMPVLMIATYNEDGSVNVMNAAWGTMVERDIVALNLSEGQKPFRTSRPVGPSPSASPTRPTWWRPTISAWSPGTRWPTS